MALAPHEPDVTFVPRIFHPSLLEHLLAHLVLSARQDAPDPDLPLDGRQRSGIDRFDVYDLPVHERECETDLSPSGKEFRTFDDGDVVRVSKSQTTESGRNFVEKFQDWLRHRELRLAHPLTGAPWKSGFFSQFGQYPIVSYSHSPLPAPGNGPSWTG